MSSNKNHFDSIEFPSPFFRLHQRSKRRPKCSFRGSAHSAHGFVRIGRCAHAPFRVFRGVAISRGAVTRGIQGCDQPWRWGAQPANSGLWQQGQWQKLRSMKTLPRVVEVVRQSLHDMSKCQAEQHWPCNWKHHQRESIDASVALPPRRGSGALGPSSSCSAF